MGNPVFRARLANGAVERELTPGVHTVGRSAENNIQLDDLSVSRRHARIVVEDGAIHVEDLGSSGGTSAGGQRLPARTPHALGEGEALRFGDVQVEIGLPAPETPPEPPAPEAVPDPAVATGLAGSAAGGAALSTLPVEAEAVLPPSNGHGNGASEAASGVPEQPDASLLRAEGGELLAEPSTEAADVEAFMADGEADPPLDAEPALEPALDAPSPSSASVIDPAPPLAPLTPATPVSLPDVPAFEATPPPAFEPLPPAAEPALAAPPPPPSRVRMALALSQAAIDPGQPATVTATLTNRGNIVEELTLSVADIPADWVTVTPQTLPLMPNAQAQATIIIRPPKSSEALAADYAFTVAARSAATGQEAVVVGTFTLRPFEDIAAALEPAQAGRDFRVEVRNNGNAPTAFAVEGRDDEEALRFDLGQGRVEADPGETGRLPVRVKPGKRPWTGREETKPFKVRLIPEAGGAEKELAGRLVVSPVIGSPRRVLTGLGALLAALAGVLALVFLQCGGGDEALVAVPTPTPVPAAVIAKEEAEDVHLCAPEEGGPPPAPAAGFIRDVPPAILARLPGSGVDETAPLFAQNDSRWASEEYARAKDDEFRSQNLCGSTIAQCGCAMTSVATVMSLFQVATMPDGQALTPEQLNSWMNIGAQRTGRGWVSQGYIYGDVIWAAANQLSAEIAKARPGTPTVRFRGIGSGSEEQIRAELAAGRPIILEVPGHWIAAVGIDPATNQILINDPFYADRTTLDVYAGKVRSSVMFEASSDLSALVVTVPSDLRVRVIDPQGHVVGTFDRGTPTEAAQKAIRDIPGASYVFKHSWRDPNCINRSPGPDDGTHQITITGPDAGKYRIEVVNPAGGPTSVAVHVYDEDGNLTMHTEDENSDQQIDIDISGPTPTPTSTGTVTPTNTPTATPTATSTGTATPQTDTPTATPTFTATPTISPTAVVVQPPTTNATCGYQVADGPYAGVIPSAGILFTCTGTFTPQREGTTTNWYVIETNGDIARFSDYTNSPSFEYYRSMSSGEKITIRFEACYRTRCSDDDVVATVTINAPQTPCTPTTNDNDGDCVPSSDEELYGSQPNNTASVPENHFYLQATCHDGVDNDKDGFVDGADQGCVVIL